MIRAAIIAVALAGCVHPCITHNRALGVTYTAMKPTDQCLRAWERGEIEP